MTYTERKQNAHLQFLLLLSSLDGFQSLFEPLNSAAQNILLRHLIPIDGRHVEIKFSLIALRKSIPQDPHSVVSEVPTPQNEVAQGIDQFFRFLVHFVEPKSVDVVNSSKLNYAIGPLFSIGTEADEIRQKCRESL